MKDSPPLPDRPEPTDVTREPAQPSSEAAAQPLRAEVSLSALPGLPSPGLQSHALVFSDASLQGSPETAAQQALSPEARADASLQQLPVRRLSESAQQQQQQPQWQRLGVPAPATPDSMQPLAAEPQEPGQAAGQVQAQEQPEQEAAAAAPGQTPELRTAPQLTPYFTAQSSWAPSGQVYRMHSGLGTPGSPALADPASAEEPASLGVTGGFSTNPLYGQTRSGPPSVRGMRQLLVADLAPSPMAALPYVAPEGGQQPRAQPAGLSELAQLDAQPRRGAALVTQAFIRAADAAAAGPPVRRQLSGAASLTPRLRGHLQADKLSAQLEQLSIPEQACGQPEQGGAQLAQQGDVPAEEGSGSLTARSQALQRLKERNLSRALQSGALSARCAGACPCKPHRPAAGDLLPAASMPQLQGLAHAAACLPAAADGV